MNIEYQYGNNKVIVEVQRLVEGLSEDERKFLLAALALKIAESIGEK